MTLKKQLRTILLIVLLTGSEAVSSEGKIKKLFTGDKAPFNGALIDDEGLRQIDIEQIEKNSCEKRLKEMPPQSVTNVSWELFALGLVVGGFGVWTLSH